VAALRPHRPALALAVAIAFVGAAAALAQPLLARQVIAAIEADRPVVGLAVVLAGALLVAAALSGVQRYVLQRTGEALVLETRTALVRRLLRLPVAELDRRRTGDLISRVGADTTLLRRSSPRGWSTWSPGSSSPAGPSSRWPSSTGSCSA
jgi:ABC-type multidrug transport system fused ATPase/permease subunit